MPPAVLRKELESIEKDLRRWEAEARALFWCGIALACLWALGLSDVLLRLERSGRFVMFAALLVLVVAGIRQVSRALASRRNIEAVAAIVEKTFPQLDNHVINYLQFATRDDGDVFKRAYVRRGVPEWSEVNPRRMRNRRALRNSLIALAAGLLLLGVPWVVNGHTWTVSLWRVLNPFSNVPPVTYTRILEVGPGDVTVPRGDPVTLTCRVQGKRGHRVTVDIKPSDDKKTSYQIGSLSGSGEEVFSYRIAKVTTDMTYRWRAGDATVPDWQTVTARPPLAFNEIRLEIVPPDYTRILPRTFDGLADDVEIPQGSEVRLFLEPNSKLQQAALLHREGAPTALTSTDEGVWTAVMRVTDGTAIDIAATNVHAETAQAKIPFRLLPDRLPEIEVTAPLGRTVLAEGTAPEIRFRASDDFGLTDVALERIAIGMAKDASGTVVQTWTPDGQRTVEATWTAEPEGAGPFVYRLVARDTYPFETRTVKSSAIIFDTSKPETVAEKKEEARAEGAGLLKRIVDLQRSNLERTLGLEARLEEASGEEWAETVHQQEAIRKLTREVLRHPARPVGGMTPVLQELYRDEMIEAVSELGRVATVTGPEKAASVSRSVDIERTILRKLTQANVAAKKVEKRRRVSELLSMLEALVKGQEKVLASTDEFIKSGLRVGESLVDRQDELASDTTRFVRACRKESAALAGTDKTFSELVLRVADLCEQKDVDADMFRAAEQLDNNEPQRAVPHEKKALASLEELHAMLNEWRMANAEEKLVETTEALEEATDKMGKLADLQAKVVEAMKRVKTQEDMSDEERDLFEEEIAEVKENMKDALLQVPTDLHIFNELSVANELVEDVYSVFEEVDRDRNAPPESADDRKVSEVLSYLKEEALLDKMQEASGRMEEMEMWLAEKAEDLKITAEAFDQEEMEFMALGALPTSMEDLIGDLIEEEEEAAEEADDGAVNFGSPDVAPGWEVAEGETTSFAAQGKSGNQMPDHKEQDGRSNVGRQGMASGETAAGSGTIGEGDPNIEKRMTQDPLQSGQVQADGEADENATGGGKQASGAADERGMAGTGSDRRMDSTAQGSLKGLESLMAKTQALHVKASLLNLRTESLEAAAHHLRQATDAIAQNYPISQVREFQRRAAGALRQAQTELDRGVAVSLETDRPAGVLDEAVEAGPDNAPANYRDLVAEYYKSLGEAL